MENQESFDYTYSSEQYREVEKIRSEYIPREESKLDRLRRLHHSATKKAQAWAITLGALGSIVLGAGMSLIMTDLSAILGMDPNLGLVLGILVGLLGLVLVTLAYPVYGRVLRRQRQRIAPEILRLSEELLGGSAK